MTKSFGRAKITVDVIMNDTTRKDLDRIMSLHQRHNTKLLIQEKKLERARITAAAKAQAANVTANAVTLASERKLTGARAKESSKVTAAKINADAISSASSKKLAGIQLIEARKTAEAKAKLLKETTTKSERELKRRNSQHAKAIEEDKKRTFQAAKIRDQALEQNRKKTEQLAKAEKRRSDQLQRSLKRDQESWKAASREVGQYAIRIAAVGTAISVGFLKASGDQEKAVDMVVSKMAGLGASEKEVARITKIVTDTAIEASRGLGMTGTAAAEAAVFLAQAGQSAEEVQKNLRPILLLKATDAFADMRQVADFVTDAMTALGIETKDTAGFVDQLAFTTARSNTDLTQMAEAVKYLAPLMSDFAKEGASATDQAAEMNAIIGLLADAGLKGSLATRAFTTSLFRFTKESGATEKALDSLGLSMFDGDGKSKGLTRTIRDMAEAFKDMTPKQRLSNLETIVGGNAAQEFSIILKKAETGLVDFQEAIVNSGGAAQQQADIALSNLSSAFADMQAEVVKTGASFGDMKKGAIKDLVDGITSLLISIQGLSDENKTLAVNSGVTIIKLSALAGVMGKFLIPNLISTAAEMGIATTGTKLFGVTAKGAAIGVNVLAGALGGLWVGWEIGTWINDVSGLKDKFEELGVTLGKIKGQVSIEDQLSGIRDMRQAVEQASESANRATTSMTGYGSAIKSIPTIQDIFSNISPEKAAVIENHLSNMGITLSDKITDENLKDVAGVLDDMELTLARIAVGAGKPRASGGAKHRPQPERVADAPTGDTDTPTGSGDSGEDFTAKLAGVSDYVESDLGIRRGHAESIAHLMTGSNAAMLATEKTALEQRLANAVKSKDVSVSEMSAMRDRITEINEVMANDALSASEKQIELDKLTAEERAAIALTLAEDLADIQDQLTNALFGSMENFASDMIGLAVHGFESRHQATLDANEEEKKTVKAQMGVLRKAGKTQSEDYAELQKTLSRLNREGNDARRLISQDEADNQDRIFKKMLADSLKAFSQYVTKMLFQKGILAAGPAGLVVGIGASIVGGLFGLAGGGRVPGYPSGGSIAPQVQSGIIGRGGNSGTPTNMNPGDDQLFTGKTGEMVLNYAQQNRAEQAWPDIWSNIGVPGFAGGGSVGGSVSNTTNRSTSDNRVFNLNFAPGAFVGNVDPMAAARTMAEQFKILSSQGEPHTSFVVNGK